MTLKEQFEPYCIGTVDLPSRKPQREKTIDSFVNTFATVIQASNENFELGCKETDEDETRYTVTVDGIPFVYLLATTNHKSHILEVRAYRAPEVFNPCIKSLHLIDDMSEFSCTIYRQAAKSWKPKSDFAFEE